MARLRKMYIKIMESINNTHYISTSHNGICWSGTESYTDAELKDIADKIYKTLGLK